ncbi:hypothetical protein GTP45_07960 [Pseudoduganella sp. FT55W]|uniref:Uncharacterized protein n=1 Tax=Duganella rivi TaxID=2666083 RepID=A0A7X4KB39_9BURK|nr:hypothetical protein [Duganella rivi]MYM66760.1 hypothetical protein [Duganella rivi]
MNSFTDKDYIDAKLDATVARFTGELKAHELIVNARIEELARNTDTGFKSLHDEFTAKFAKFEGRLIKWVVATVLGGVVLNTSIMTALLLNRPPQVPVAPIVIYAQPVPQPSR